MSAVSVAPRRRPPSRTRLIWIVLWAVMLAFAAGPAGCSGTSSGGKRPHVHSAKKKPAKKAKKTSKRRRAKHAAHEHPHSHPHPPGDHHHHPHPHPHLDGPNGHHHPY